MPAVRRAEHSYVPGRLWATLWSCTQLAAGTLCVAVALTWLPAHQASAVPLSALSDFPQVVEAWRSLLTFVFSTIVPLSVSLLGQLSSVCCGAVVNQVLITSLQKRARPVDILVSLGWLLILSCCWFKIVHVRQVTAVTSAVIFWLAQVARQWRSRAVSARRTTGSKPLASHLRRRTSTKTLSLPDEESEDTTDDDNDSHSERQESTLNTHLFNMSLGPAGADSPKVSPTQRASWLKSAKEKGLYSSSAEASDDGQLRRRHDSNKQLLTSSPPKPIVFPARFTASPPSSPNSLQFSTAPTLPLRTSSVLNHSPPASADFQQQRRRQRRNTFSDDEDELGLVSYADRVISQEEDLYNGMPEPNGHSRDVHVEETPNATTPRSPTGQPHDRSTGAVPISRNCYVILLSSLLVSVLANLGMAYHILYRP